MFPQQPTPRRIATSPDQRTHATEYCDQRKALQDWLWKLIRCFDDAVHHEVTQDTAMLDDPLDGWLHAWNQ